jgi:hypothetical protein
MTEEVVSALMSAADEEAWERAGLFDPPPSHLNPELRIYREFTALRTVASLGLYSYSPQGFTTFC